MCEQDKNYSLLQQVCIECCNDDFEEYEQIEKQTFSKKYKRKMNRIGREEIGLKNALHPEVDNLFERTRSNIIYWWKNKQKAKK